MHLETLEDKGSQELVRAFQSGDPDAFTEIVATYRGVLLARARRQLRNSDDAQDAVQETFLRAYRSLPEFAGKYQLAAWLNRILDNVVADMKRRYGGEVRLRVRLAGVREEGQTTEDLITDEAAGERLRAAVSGALASLSETHRQAFVLREVEDRSYTEVAALMAITEMNARARVHRARASLQRSLRSIGPTLGAVVAPLCPRIPSLRAHWTNRSADTFATAPLSAPVGSSSWSVTQTVALSSPGAQSVLSVASEAGRSLLPSTGALVTLASAAAAIMTPVIVLLAPLVPTTPALAPVAQIGVPQSPGAWSSEPALAADSTPTTSPIPSTTTTTTQPSVAAASVAATAAAGSTPGAAPLAAWTSQTVPSGAGGLYGVACPSASDCSAVGGAGTLPGAGVILATTNGGTTWTSQTVPSGAGGLYGVACPSASDCSAVGGAGTLPGAGVILATTNGGTTWTSQTVPSGAGGLYGVACPSASDCSAVGGAGTLPGAGVILTAPASLTPTSTTVAVSPDR